ncbi:cation diffusion facilitator family transporter [Aquipuribacter hungaricus]|uniref:Cation diffusion facilitator family transporter n=1 Tax=Aquipuribacter hungaricus TaxID=545624 RepID=A0ABV7WKF5_9MICO
MSGGHSHSHGLPAAGGEGPASRRYRRRMLLVLAITLSVVGVQVVGGLVSGSLALLADAGHMLTDAAGVGIALLASTIALRPATDSRSYGWQRAEILAALANALLLAGIAVWVLWQAVARWDEPPEVATGVMLAAAVVGAVANAVSLLVLRGGQAESLNVRGAYLEVLGDLLGSVAVVVAGLVIVLTGWTRADVVASVVIGLMILPRAWSLLRDVLDVLLEATPRGVDMDEVRSHILEVSGVVDVHDLHAWTITSGVPVLSAHVVVDDDCLAAGRSGQVLDRLGECLTGHFDVSHCTFQLEPVGHSEHEAAHHR